MDFRMLDSAMTEVDAERSGDGEEDYRPVISSYTNYHKFLKLVHSDSIYENDEEDFDPELRSNGLDDDSLSSPTYEAAAQSDANTPVYQDPLERERQMLEWREELLKVEGEIATLKQVLGTKVRHASELKRKMGITPFQEFKTDVSSGIQQIRSSDSYQKTNEKLHQINDKIVQSSAYQKTAAVTKTVGEKTSAAFSNIGSSVSRKIGDLRNSSTFKSLEESVGHTYASVKTSRSIENLKDRLARVSGSRSSTSVDEQLSESAGDDDAVQSPTTPGSLPEEKVPL
ncbi:tumor protein D54-like isoform X4 [Haliotis rubra]|uniref:tumor protein D54-like isoform X4 n=1 Tax=Haliotis rubra TaxID=36100 RepID=UPI001EE4EEE9|nr:tumor protein D54-like isoform X4 [Haliotis rubra]